MFFFFKQVRISPEIDWLCIGWMKFKIRLSLSQLGCSWQLGLSSAWQYHNITTVNTWGQQTIIKSKVGQLNHYNLDTKSTNLFSKNHLGYLFFTRGFRLTKARPYLVLCVVDQFIISPCFTEIHHVLMSTTWDTFFRVIQCRTLWKLNLQESINAGWLYTTWTESSNLYLESRTG